MRRVFRYILHRTYGRVRWLVLQLKGLVIFGKNVGILGNFHVSNPDNVTIGRNCGINHGVFILGHKNITIGDNVVISARAMLIDAGLDTQNLSNNNFPKHVSAGIVVEDNVWIGAGAIILPGVTLGRGSVVAAGAVVTRSVAVNMIVGGVPARTIGRTDE